MRLLYLYPEEWTGRRAREVHTLQTCLALAEAGADVVLVTAEGEVEKHRVTLTTARRPPGFENVPLSRRWGPLKSARFFQRRLERWLRDGTMWSSVITAPADGRHFDVAYIIHLKAAAMLRDAGIPYWYEAHEIFAETPPRGSSAEQKLHALESDVLRGAVGRIATSHALAQGLADRYGLPNDFHIVPHGGDPVSVDAKSQADPAGPFVYAGSIADWKGLDLALQGAKDAGVPLRIIGGSNEDWRKLKEKTPADLTSDIDWRPRVPGVELPKHLAGARAGLIPTLPDTGTGHYSCPMKLYDYARAGLPVAASALPALESLGLGPWCRRVETSSSWAAALSEPFPAVSGAEALAWARENTWRRRGERLREIIGGAAPSAGS